mgnify:CR=1 FL=1
MIIAILEWNSDKGVQPIVLVADDQASARRAAVQAITPYLPSESNRANDINDIDAEWVQDNPLPDLDDDASVTAWLDAFKEETTDLWLAIYTPADTPGAEDTYTDTRST